MLRIITLPFRLLRGSRFALIACGAMVTGLGLWLQINGVPPMIAPAVDLLRQTLGGVMDPQITVFGMLSKLGGVLALLGLLGMILQDLTRRTTTAAPQFVPVPGQAADAAHSTWQDRLAARTASKSTDEPASLAAHKPRFSLAKALQSLGALMVIGAVLAVLGAAFLGPDSAPQSATQTLAQSMIRAQLAGAGDALALDVAIGAPATASPRAFDLPQIDPATFVPWAREVLTRASAGDQDAMLMLGAIAGGLVAVLLGLKVIFGTGRRKSTRGTTTGKMQYT